MQKLKVNMATTMLRKHTALQIQAMSLRKCSQSALKENTKPCEPKLCEKTPVEHTMHDHLQMYSINSSLLSGRLSNAIPKHYLHVSKAIHGNSLMIRKPALEVIDILRQSQNDAPPKLLLHGPKGGGKSLSLLHVIHYCMLRDMVILYVPNPYKFIDANNGSIKESSWKPSRYDQPEASITWINVFSAMNHKFITETKTTQEYKWGQREVTAKGKPLQQILEQGCSREIYANDAVGILLKEIRLNKDLEVLYAVDAVNGLFGATSHKVENEPVDIKSLALVEMFTKLLKPEYTLTKGAYVAATSRTVQYFKPITVATNEHQSMEQLFDQSSLSRLSDFLDVEVPNYSEEEYITMLNFYNQKGWLTREITDNLVNQLRFLTNRNPTFLSTSLRTL